MIIKKAQKGLAMVSPDVVVKSIVKPIVYKIIDDKNVSWHGGFKIKDIPSILFKKGYNDSDKRAFIFGPRVPYVNDGNAYDWQKEIDENNYHDVRSFQGEINPFNEYLVNDRDRGLVEELANHNHRTWNNVNDEYSDPITHEWYKNIPIPNDVHGYSIVFHNDENGNPVISASDLYDFGKDYAESFKGINRSDISAKSLEIQRRLLNWVGHPYKLVQTNIPIRFVNNPQGFDIERVNNFTNSLFDRWTSEDIAKKLDSGYIEPSYIIE